MSSLQGLAIKADGYTNFIVVLLVVDFLIVQSHFLTMLKFDQSASDAKIKVFCILAILLEFLVLTPLYLINSLDLKGGICIVLVPTAFTFVS
jgi:predicted metallopeptidase